ncbi:ABC TRANSPORTER B FAMILY PROTEIN [Salix koriyanagi]|uniref:ABC TRANSPORTER B FAMILY PROTEIN n=1 Tax=Salix koriyanagi TaxID=2511006 RepID=A0A9Q0VQZ6_9ROSI|nr:ABC TRANSPORTER B FAMILY PROTEIN [Salix koriyanagi]
MNNLAGSESSDTAPDVFSDNINKNALALCYLACGQWLVCFTGERQATRMRTRYLKAVLRQEVGYFDLHVSSTAEIITGVSNDSFVIQDVLSEKMPNFLMNVSTFIGCYIMAFVLLWRLAIVMFPFILLLVIPGVVYGKILIGISRKMKQEYSKAETIAEQAISSARTIYAFVGETKAIAAYSAALQLPLKLGLKQGMAKGLAVGSNAVIFAVWSFMSYYGSRLVMYHGSRGGNVFNAGACVMVGGLSFGAGLSNMKYFADACSAGERKSVALVGGSGSGKSTAIALLQRFYDPFGGEILVDGIPIDKLQLKWLRSQIGLVSQEPALFATTIMENILFGKETATMDEVVQAAKTSNAHNFISQFPQGYSTQVGERGVQLSGGQKQRIAIARAVIKSPRILLLDEATSALDTESERNVQGALDRAAVGRTTIIISHRLSTIRNVDVIAVVQDARTDKPSENVTTTPVSSSAIPIMKANNRTGSGTGGRRLSPVQISRSANSVAPSQVSISTEENAAMEEQRFSAPSFRRLLALNLPEWKQASFGCLGAILFGAVQPVYAFVLGSMISVFFLKDHDEIKEKIRIYSFFFLGLTFFSLIINVIQHYNFAYMGEHLTKRIRERMLSKILTFEVGWFDQDENSSGSICSRLTKDANVVRSVVGDRMALVVQTMSAVTIAWTMGLVIAWRLAIVMIAVQPVMIACYYTRSVLLRKYVQKSHQSTRRKQQARCRCRFQPPNHRRFLLSGTDPENARESPRGSAEREYPAIIVSPALGSALLGA